jgi:hypothetical protein
MFISVLRRIICFPSSFSKDAAHAPPFSPPAVRRSVYLRRARSHRLPGRLACIAGPAACAVLGTLISATGTAGKCATRAAGMLATTGLWNMMTARLGKTDGIVPGRSQIYPNATKNFEIPKGDSHVGETKSSLTREKLRFALRDYQGVIPRVNF